MSESESGNGRTSKVVTDVYKSIYALECYYCGLCCLHIRLDGKELRGCLGLAEWSLRWRIMLRWIETRGDGTATVTRPVIPAITHSAEAT